ncbi:MAG: phosphotransferase [Candidatus Thorarchaeota archaeon]|jgi:Ser/Thr protein kinase RdoA (MazF antagonist)
MSREGTISKTHLKQACERYNVAPEEMTFAGGMENAVYSCKKNGQTIYLRFGHSSHMTFNLVTAEIDWVVYLLDKNVPAARPMKSGNGIYVERIGTSRDSYNVVAFEKAEGEQLEFGDPKRWHDDVIKDWGKTIGRIHSVTKDYKPKSARRYEFHPELDLFLIKRENMKVREKISALFQKMHELPKGKDAYGLIHSDIHVGNFFVKDGKISAILDFDRACYKWFISEIAISLYYPLYVTSLRNDSNEQKEFALRFLPTFLEGYATENSLDSTWFEHLQMFMQVRDAILLMYLPPSVPEEVRGRFRRRIIGKDPYTNIQFENL